MAIAEAKLAKSCDLSQRNTDKVLVTLTDAIDRRVTLEHLCLCQERNEWLIGSRLDEELQRVAIVIDPLQRVNDRFENRAAGD